MSIARPTISKLLSEARELSLVEFNVKYPFRNRVLEEKIIKTFNLDDAVIIEISDNLEKSLLIELGMGTSNYISPMLKNLKTIGISWGQSLYNMIDKLKVVNSSVKYVVQMLGATGYENSSYNGHLLAQYLSKKINSNCLMLHAPLVVENKQLAISLMSDNNIKNTIENACSVDIALVGIGCSKLEYNSLYKTGYITEGEVLNINNSGAVGDICGHYYDINGVEMNIDINSRVIGVNLKQIKKIKNVMGVAGGSNKIQAILGALNGNYINTLITDSKSAHELLYMKK